MAFVVEGQAKVFALNENFSGDFYSTSLPVSF